MIDTRISPAPWAATISTSDLDGQFFTIADINHAASGPYRGSVARLQSAEHIVGIGANEVVANAHLIAAAPDLYEALEAVIAVADRNTVEFDRAKAALAKARGAA